MAPTTATRIITTFTFILIIASSSCCAAAAAETLLTLRSVNTTLHADAICNDGSVYKFYEGGNLSSTRLLVFVNPGGYAASDLGMAYRDPDYLTSTTLPHQVTGLTLLSADPSINPDFHDWHFVMLPYCSSDLWLGNATRNVSGGRSYDFAGRAILAAAMDALLGSASDSSDVVNGVQTDTLVVAGASAGGIGAMSFAQQLHDTYSLSASASGHLRSISLIIDSAWFVNQDQALSRNVSDAGFSYLGAGKLSSCQFKHYIYHAKSGYNPNSNNNNNNNNNNGNNNNNAESYPCCVSARCMLAHFVPQNISVILLAGLFDAYIMADVVTSYDTTDSAQDKPQLVWIVETLSAYAAAMNVSAPQTIGFDGQVAVPLATFQPACFGHVLLCPSGLLCSPDSALYPYQGGFEQTVGENLKFVAETHLDVRFWTSTTVRGKSMRDVVGLWWAATQTGNESLIDGLRFHDTCKGIQCNPTCVTTVDMINTQVYVDNTLNAVVALMFFLALCAVFLLWRGSKLFPAATLTSKVQPVEAARQITARRDSEIVAFTVWADIRTYRPAVRAPPILTNVRCCVSSGKLTALMGPR